MKDAQKPDHARLNTLINRLKEGRYVIPDFQREFEWKPWDNRFAPEGTGGQMHWFFNTDESEVEGKGAHEKMIQKSCIAAWGDCRGRGAEELLNLPADGDKVFLYLVGAGIVASGVFTDDISFKGNDVFNTWGEYHRPLVNLKTLPDIALSPGVILEKTGYHVPARHILCKIRNTSAIKLMESFF